MQRFLKKYSRECRAGMLLVVVYSIHLFAIGSLLADPNDHLSRNSFNHHHTDPQATTDYLLLLAKKDVAKQTVCADLHLPFLKVSPIQVFYPQALLQPSDIAFHHLSEDCYKRYRLLRVLLV
jgi:hypothetical protein